MPRILAARLARGAATAPLRIRLTIDPRRQQWWRFFVAAKNAPAQNDTVVNALSQGRDGSTAPTAGVV